MEIRLPSLGVGMTEGTLVQWLVEDGSTVTEGQPIYELETEKVNTDIEAPGAGTIRQIATKGGTYDVGALVAEIS